ncbi:vWA domain-containing protein [Porphyromonas levii]|uniref:vWA domain-containing protein n=1 Tax=Porphyromonas levii TaxID=28114 RepID=UPI002012B824|nr:VWA domain-containing protein [Porphyromonas levii]
MLIPLGMVAIYLFWRMARQRKELKRFGDTELVRLLMPDLSLRRKLAKEIVLLLAIAMLVMTLARPQMGSKSEKVERQGIELMVAMDISNSMLSNDVKPSRLARAKAIVSKMIDKLGNNKIGLIFFAGDAYVQLPITGDMISAKMFLNNAAPDLIQIQGTALEDAINLAVRSFSSDDQVSKAIVVITDAEDHEGNVISAVEDARKYGVLVDIVGVGSPEGGPIPMPEGGYLQSNEGMVITKLNEQLGMEIATASGGIYVRANDVSQTVKLLQESIEKLDQSELEMTIYSAYNEVYYIPLTLALLLLAVYFVLLDRKNRYFKRIQLFEQKNKK